MTSLPEETRHRFQPLSLWPPTADWMTWTFPVILLVTAAIAFRLAPGTRGPIDEEMVFLKMTSPSGTLLWGLFDVQFPYRFLHELLWGVGYKLYGWHFHRYFWMMPALHWLNAIVYWRILLKLIPRDPWIAAGASLLFLVYPADPTGTVLGMLGHNQSLLLYLVGVLLMLQIAESETVSLPRLGIMSFVVLASMLSYEQLTPLTVLTPVLLLMTTSPRITPHKLRIAVAWWGSVAILALFRIYLLIFTTLGEYGYGGGRPSHAPLDLLRSYVGWVRLGSVEAWYWALRRLRPALALGSPEVRSIPLGLFLACLVGLFGFGLLMLLRNRGVESPDEMTAHGSDKRLLLILIAGGLLVAAITYSIIPLIYNPPVSTDLFQNRNNTAPALGFALAYASLIFGAARFAARTLIKSPKWRAWVSHGVAWGLITVLSTIGILWNITRADYWQADWDVTKAPLWRELLATASDIQSNTLVVFVLKDEHSPVQMRGGAYITPMLNILYDDSSLAGDNIGASQWVNQGVRFTENDAQWGGEMYTYDRVVFISVLQDISPEHPTVEMEVLRCLPADLIPADLAIQPCGNPDRVQSSGERSQYAQELLGNP